MRQTGPEAPSVFSTIEMEHEKKKLHLAEYTKKYTGQENTLTKKWIDVKYKKY